MNEVNNDINNDNYLSDVMHTLFNATARGVTYWRKHRYHKCYKCGVYGHIAIDCSNICQLCGNLHNKTVCVYSLVELYRKINKKITREIIRDPEEINRFVERKRMEITLKNSEEQREVIKEKLVRKPEKKKVKIVKYIDLGITTPCSYQYQPPLKEEDKLDKMMKELNQHETLEVLQIRLDNILNRIQKFGNNPKEKLSKKKLIETRKKLMDKILAKKQDNNGKNGNDNNGKNGNDSKQNQNNGIITIGETTEIKVEQWKTKTETQVIIKKVKIQEKKILTKKNQELQIMEEKLKKKINLNKKWITDYEAFHAQKRDLTKMEQQEEQAKQRLKKITKTIDKKFENLKNKQARINEKYEHINQAYKKLNKKKQAFYDKKEEIYNDIHRKTMEANRREYESYKPNSYKNRMDAEFKRRVDRYMAGYRDDYGTYYGDNGYCDNGDDYEPQDYWEYRREVDNKDY
jgi:hypothetical protein